MIVWQRPNLLLLVEPTNHLDLATREALAMALNEFEGTVMLVSHDRALLRSVCDEFWMVSRGGVAPFDGDLDDYQRYLLDEARRQRELVRQAAQAVVASPPPAPVVRTESRSAAPLRSELQRVEARMQTLQGQGTELEARLGAAARPADIAEVGVQLQQVQQELQQLEDRWLDLSARLEAVEA
jgi:ATP-binding cassette subfamily F protein 3